MLINIAERIWAVVRPPRVQKPLRLNIGCGNRRRDGYINVDTRRDANPDLVRDAWDLFGIPRDEVDEIYSRHMLEHLDPDDAKLALSHWLMLLKPGGSANIIVPDLIFAGLQIAGQVSSSHPDQMRHAMASLYGWRAPNRGGNREDAHRWGYTEEALTSVLVNVGFCNVSRVLTGPDSQPWHLNLLASRPSR